MGESSKSKVVNGVTPLTCQHCAGPLSKEMETSLWTVPPLIRDSFSMIGSAVGGTTSAFYGFNYVMPTVRKWVKGPIWLHFLIGAPPVIVFSSACAGFSGFDRLGDGGFGDIKAKGCKREQRLVIPVTMARWVVTFWALILLLGRSEQKCHLEGGAVPALAQLASSSYHAAMLSPSLSHSSQKDNTEKSRTSSTCNYS